MSSRRACCVNGCQTIKGKMHRFPQPGNERFQKWVEATNNLDIINGNPRKVFNGRRFCNKHFEPFYFVPDGRLSRYAVPTIDVFDNNSEETDLEGKEPPSILLQQLIGSAGPVHEALKPLSWLIGTWKSISAKGQYPTIKPFSYGEEMEFLSVGQPILNYKSVTWHPEKKNPMHLESGFLRIKPGSNQVALLLAHNFGLTSLEEGTVEDSCVNLKSTTIGRMSFGKDPAVTELTRSYRYCCDSNQLELVVCMATSNTPLVEHLRIKTIMQAGPTHEALKPLCWLIGKWKSLSARGIYPTIQPFQYCEEMEFASLGQPLLRFNSTTWHPKTKNPMHLESGFLRIKPDSNQVAFLLGHNLGITSLEEGIVDGNCINLKSTDIGRMCFVKNPPVLELVRTYTYCNDQLEMVICMATCTTALTEHIRVKYKKMC